MARFNERHKKIVCLIIKRIVRDKHRSSKSNKKNKYLNKMCKFFGILNKLLKKRNKKKYNQIYGSAQGLPPWGMQTSP